ncbi:hypothetical protein [Scytonema sp. PCC 10023]|uniref:hypothetical protein n=1 Tax=Scytonema sp. PCC 10023 TaxID=1680591 RepID=UPI0039C63B5E
MGRTEKRIKIHFDKLAHIIVQGILLFSLLIAPVTIAMTSSIPVAAQDERVTEPNFLP